MTENLQDHMDLRRRRPRGDLTDLAHRNRQRQSAKGELGRLFVWRARSVSGESAVGVGRGR